MSVCCVGNLQCCQVYGGVRDAPQTWVKKGRPVASQTRVSHSVAELSLNSDLKCDGLFNSFWQVCHTPFLAHVFLVCILLNALPYISWTATKLQTSKVSDMHQFSFSHSVKCAFQHSLSTQALLCAYWPCNYWHGLNGANLCVSLLTAPSVSICTHHNAPMWQNVWLMLTLTRNLV